MLASSQKNDVELKTSEMQARDEGVKIEGIGYDVEMFGRYWFFAEVAPAIRELRTGKDDLILDLGAGIGRITVELVNRGYSVIAVDFSKESLRALRERSSRKVQAIRADASFLPVMQSSFEKVICCQVFEHIPSEASRMDAILEAQRVLKPKGMFIMTVYNWGIGQRMLMGKKEGYHSPCGGRRIYYYPFKPSEVRRMFAQAKNFQLKKIKGIVVVPHFLVRRIGNISIFLEKLICTRQLLEFSVGRLILAVAVKTS